MIKVITYGTFDLFHEGHYRLLKRAKKLGDYLVVGVTSEEYDQARGKLMFVVYEALYLIYFWFYPNKQPCKSHLNNQIFLPSPNRL